MRPTADETYKASVAKASTGDAHVRMLREHVSGTRCYTLEQLQVAAKLMTEAHTAFGCTVAPISGYGPNL
jgi:hypothetical protein